MHAAWQHILSFFIDILYSNLDNVNVQATADIGSGPSNFPHIVRHLQFKIYTYLEGEKLQT